VRIDESLFLGGMNKAEFLQSFKADIFFDDQQQNIEDASAKVTSAHVPFGIKNRK
jgi:5'-nucleotidase